MQKRNVLISCLVVVVIMYSFSFALAPLYKKFCKVTGINISLTEKEFFSKEDLKRDIKVQFVATNNETIPWKFYPEQNTINVHPNQKAKVIFYVKNTTQKSMTVQAIPSYAPTLSSQYFHKIECFCFRQQTLEAGAEKKLAVVFQIDSKLPKEINTITLAYTLFDVT